MKRFSQHFLSEDPDFYGRKQEQNKLNQTISTAFYASGGTPKELSGFYDKWRRTRKDTDFELLRTHLGISKDVNNEQIHKAMVNMDLSGRFLPDV